jgi:hypothetical protein
MVLTDTIRMLNAGLFIPANFERAMVGGSSLSSWDGCHGLMMIGQQTGGNDDD